MPEETKKERKEPIRMDKVLEIVTSACILEGKFDLPDKVKELYTLAVDATNDLEAMIVDILGNAYVIGKTAPYIRIEEKGSAEVRNKPRVSTLNAETEFAKGLRVRVGSANDPITEPEYRAIMAKVLSSKKVPNTDELQEMIDTLRK